MRLRGGNVAKYLKELEFTASFDLKRLQAHQLSKLKELVRFAYSNVPFYKRRFKEMGLKPDDVTSLQDITKLPMLTKNDLRTCISDLIVPGTPARVLSTSGSTGYPLTFPKDFLSLSYWDAAMYLGMGWHGIRLGDKQARFWGIPIHWRDRVNAQLKDALMNRSRISAFDVSEHAFYSAYKRLCKSPPKYIYGYPSLVYRFCLFLQAHSLNVASWSLSAAVLTGETVYPFQREIIQSVLHCRVVNEYGSTENGIIAFECPSGGMHIFAPNVLVEVIKDSRHAEPYEVGEIYVTELNSRSLAFIRYRTLDMGSLSDRPCRCGLQYPLFHQIYGRVDNFIIASDGTLVYDAALAYILKKHVDEFHAVQRADRSLEIAVRPKRSFAENVQTILKDLRAVLGEGIPIHFTCVDELPPSAGGKMRYFEQLGTLPAEGHQF